MSEHAPALLTHGVAHERVLCVRQKEVADPQETIGQYEDITRDLMDDP